MTVTASSVTVPATVGVRPEAGRTSAEATGTEAAVTGRNGTGAKSRETRGTRSNRTRGPARGRPTTKTGELVAARVRHYMRLIL